MTFDLTMLEALLPFVAVGFAAQLIDGALGMAFGVISNTLLVSILGVAPARASSGVHLVEVFTTAASGISHAFHRNIHWWLFARLVIPGMIGGVLGAYVLINLDAAITRPFVMIYLSAFGIYLLIRSFGVLPEPRTPRFIMPLGLAGGFLDAAGGGGWGPIVTSNLLIQGGDPRKTIGTVNTAEFFLTVTVDRIHLRPRLGGVYDRDRGASDRRNCRGAAWRVAGQAHSTDDTAEAGRDRPDGDERL